MPYHSYNLWSRLKLPPNKQQLKREFLWITFPTAPTGCNNSSTRKNGCWDSGLDGINLSCRRCVLTPTHVGSTLFFTTKKSLDFEGSSIRIQEGTTLVWELLLHFENFSITSSQKSTKRGKIFDFSIVPRYYGRRRRPSLSDLLWRFELRQLTNSNQGLSSQTLSP